MKIGIIGVGSITLGLAHRAVASGHQVLINNPRGNTLVRESVEKIGTNAELVSIGEAAVSEIIILFVARQDLQGMIKLLPDMKGKTILHTNNAFFCLESLPQLYTDPRSSDALADLLPSAHIIRLYNTLKANPALPEQQACKIFFEGQDKNAKKKAKAFLETLSLSALDLGEMLN